MTQSPMQERMARVRAARGAQKANVQTTVTDEQAFLASHINKRASSQENLDGEDGSVTHNRPSTVVMWKPSPQGFFPRTVSVTAISANLENGWKAHCPDCGGDHGADPNSCPNREPIAVTSCPVCGKRIYDNQAQDLAADPDAETDPNYVSFEDYKNATPRERLQKQLGLHMWVRHPQQAMMRGLPPLPTALAEMVAESRPV